MGYSRPQLTLLLLLAAIALAGLGVREWRAGFPDAAERLDRFDREDPPPPIPPVPRPRALPAGLPLASRRPRHRVRLRGSAYARRSRRRPRQRTRAPSTSTAPA